MNQSTEKVEKQQKNEGLRVPPWPPWLVLGMAEIGTTEVTEEHGVAGSRLPSSGCGRRPRLELRGNHWGVIPTEFPHSTIWRLGPASNPQRCHTQRAPQAPLVHSAADGRDPSRDTPKSASPDLRRSFATRFRWWRRLAIDVFHANLDHRLTREDRPPGKQIVAKGSQRVNVAAGVDLVGLLDRFWGNVQRGPRDRPWRGQGDLFLRVDRLDESKVKQLDEIVEPAAMVEHDVGRLDVAVDQADAVCLGQRSADLLQNDR